LKDIDRKEANMKLIKNGMRLWITIASLFSFLAGWVLLSHSNKPAPLQINQPVISAPASNQSLRSFNRNFQTGGLPFSVQSQPSFSRPRLRTGGS
jgi:hypothetical protein